MALPSTTNLTGAAVGEATHCEICAYSDIHRPATTEFTITWHDVFEGETEDAVYLCDACADQYRETTNVNIIRETAL